MLLARTKSMRTVGMSGGDAAQTVPLQHFHFFIILHDNLPFIQLSSRFFRLGRVSRKSGEDGSVKDEGDTISDEPQHVQCHGAFPLRCLCDAEKAKLRGPTDDSRDDENVFVPERVVGTGT